MFRLQVLIPLQVLLMRVPATELDFTTGGINVIISSLLYLDILFLFQPATKLDFATGGVNIIHIPSVGSANQIHTSVELHQKFLILGHKADVLCYYTCLSQGLSQYSKV